MIVRFQGKQRRVTVASFVAILIMLTDPSAANSQGRVVSSRFMSSALEGNKQGDTPNRLASVYLPPSYETSDTSYPVLYLLHGTGGGPDSFFGGIDADGIANRLIEDGMLQELIIVGVDGRSRYSVSYYVNSELNGNHENYIVQDLVNHIDSNFRTIPERDSRGIAGHSTGGYGALLYGMKHSDVFGSVYSYSGGSHGFWNSFFDDARSSRVPVAWDAQIA